VTDFDFFEIVEVAPSARITHLGVGANRGIILGVAGDGDSKQYAVLVGAETFVFEGADLVRTGQRVNREAVYGEETVSVPPERYSPLKKDGDDSVPD
jgi:hypothetical protein